MGWAFVRRRMIAELGADWPKKFENFEHHPAAAASLGQVASRPLARRRDGRLQAAISRHAVRGRSGFATIAVAARDPPPARLPRSTPPKSPRRIGARVREELDYRREAKHAALYRAMLDGVDSVRVPLAWPELSTGRLLTSTGSTVAACSRTRTIRLPRATGWRPQCSPPGGFRSAVSASSTATRISAIHGVRG